MTCARCHGLVIDDAGDVRCLNCGHRPAVAMDDMRRETDRKEKTMPRFTSEEGRQRWLAAMARRRGRKHALPAGGGETMPAVVEPETVGAPRPRHGQAVVLTVIESAIATAQADLDALERTKEILSRQDVSRASLAGPS